MKIRNDYVSNSSSSSFIVIEGEPEKVNVPSYSDWDPLILPTDEGCYKFGWQIEDYNDFWSKLNWCAIMIGEILAAKKDGYFEDKENDNDWMKARNAELRKMFDKVDGYVKLLKDVCRKEFNIEFEIEFDEDRLYAYIDHQSGPFEDSSNLEMFDSYDDLYTFLASPNSYIHCDNDNH